MNKLNKLFKKNLQKNAYGAKLKSFKHKPKTEQLEELTLSNRKANKICHR